MVAAARHGIGNGEQIFPNYLKKARKVSSSANQVVGIRYTSNSTRTAYTTHTFLVKPRRLVSPGYQEYIVEVDIHCRVEVSFFVFLFYFLIPLPSIERLIQSAC